MSPLGGIKNLLVFGNQAGSQIFKLQLMMTVSQRHATQSFQLVQYVQRADCSLSASVKYLRSLHAATVQVTSFTHWP